MTTLSTHDTKRSEDVRARLGRAVGAARRLVGGGPALARGCRRTTATPLLDGSTEYLLLADAVRHLGRRPARRGPAAGLPASRRSARRSGTPGGRRRTRSTRRPSPPSRPQSWPTTASLDSVRRLRRRAGRVRPGGDARRRSWCSSRCPAYRTSTRAREVRRPVPGGPGQPAAGGLRRAGCDRLARLDDGARPATICRREAAGHLARAAVAPAATGWPSRPGSYTAAARLHGGHAVAFARGGRGGHASRPGSPAALHRLGGWA